MKFLYYLPNKLVNAPTQNYKYLNHWKIVRPIFHFIVEWQILPVSQEGKD